MAVATEMGLWHEDLRVQMCEVGFGLSIRVGWIILDGVFMVFSGWIK